MSSMGAVKSYSASLSQTLQESTRILMQDVQRGADRLDRKKAAISQAGLERVQQSNQTSANISAHQGKIDTYA
ncbi:hypothetical protein FNU76_21020 [Chitinimonas arctica]|uniref:Uncharacterized protein n=1 Tax=Chitinimonas arctica TaxID=2594795 RepID=A0A516SKG1_9NEIS|nr:hypothetical protein [Chitinimonas arctica]QDQ28634.1 hypothetical protein FNU76_21020 [Chitinimonas arctica]